MTYSMLGFIAIIVVSLLGWGIAELKNIYGRYESSSAEKEALRRTLQAQHDADYEELSIRDVIRTISTKGFKAV